jgi:hypothetical protein
MTKTSKAVKVIRPAATNGKISAESMVIALVKSGCLLDGIKLVEQLTAEQLERVKAAVA